MVPAVELQPKLLLDPYRHEVAVAAYMVGFARGPADMFGRSGRVFCDTHTHKVTFAHALNTGAVYSGDANGCVTGSPKMHRMGPGGGGGFLICCREQKDNTNDTSSTF